LLRDTLIGKVTLTADFSENYILKEELQLVDKNGKATSGKITVEHETSDDLSRL